VLDPRHLPAVHEALHRFHQRPSSGEYRPTKGLPIPCREARTVALEHPRQELAAEVGPSVPSAPYGNLELGEGKIPVQVPDRPHRSPLHPWNGGPLSLAPCRRSLLPSPTREDGENSLPAPGALTPGGREPCRRHGAVTCAHVRPQGCNCTSMGTTQPERG
jgi:hypothetical protein